MKKLLCILLMLLFVIPALAEGAPLSEECPYTLGAIEGVTIEESEGSLAYVYGTSRVVVIFIDRVPDEAPAEAVIRMMGQFDPNAVIGQDVPTAEGFVGISAVTGDKFGEGVDVLTVMLLSDGGELLILSGYDMSGSQPHARALLDAVLRAVTVNGQSIIITEE